MIVTVYVNGYDDSGAIRMTKKEFESMMKGINEEMDAAYKRGYEDGKASVPKPVFTSNRDGW